MRWVIYIPGKVIDGSAIPWDGCVYWKVVMEWQGLNRRYHQTSSRPRIIHLGPSYIDGETVTMKNSVWRTRVIDHCYHVDRDLGSVTLIVRVSHIDSAISSPSHLLQRNAWKYQITEVLFYNTSRVYFQPDIDSAVLRLTIWERERVLHRWPNSPGPIWGVYSYLLSTADDWGELVWARHFKHT